MASVAATKKAQRAAEQHIHAAIAAGKTKLSFDSEAFRDLNTIPPELRDIAGLTELDFDNTAIADLSPLVGMTQLRVLRINNTRVTDLSPLQGMTGLQHLFLRQTAITDLSPLQGMTGLQALSLNQTAITDLSPLQGITGLQRLYLNQTAISNLSPLQGMTALQTLSLNQTAITDLSPLQGMTALQALSLNQTAITDLSPLQGMTALQELFLSQTAITDLSPLQGMTALQALWLNQTAITDLSPLQGMTALQALYLNQTAISDLSPLQGMTGLQRLSLDQTAISDLRLLIALPKLGEGITGGLWYRGTPAVDHDPELRRLSEIKENAERTRDTIAYLKTLPPWPEPLPWDVPDKTFTDQPPELPDFEEVPNVLPSPDGLDLAHSPIDAVDRSDPIKRRIYAKLPDAVEVLYRFGNRYAEVKTPTDTLRNLVAVDFDDADLLDIHLQIAALTDARDLDAHKPPKERFDADCLAALNTVLRLGPPVTLGHPDVDLLEQRSAEYARNRLPATVAEGERRMAKGIESSPRIAKERLRKVAGQVANAPDTGRVAEYRRSLHKKTVLALAYVAGAIADASTGFVFGEVTVAAAQFLLAHKDAIMATAPSWGETGYRWLEYIIIRADQIVREARDGKDG